MDTKASYYGVQFQNQIYTLKVRPRAHTGNCGVTFAS